MSIVMKRVYIFLFSLFSCVFFSLDCVRAVDLYAKVVFIGKSGSGKSTLYDFLRAKEGGNFFNSSRQKTVDIFTSSTVLKVGGKEVEIYLNDTSAEDYHKNVIDEFSKNADVAFLMLNAEDYVCSDGSFKEDLGNEKIISEFIKRAPNCRIIIILSKLDCVGTSRKNKVKALIKAYVEDFVLQDANFKGNIDGFYDLTFKSSSLEQDRAKYVPMILDKLCESLSKCNLSNRSDFMYGKIESYENTNRVLRYRSHFLWWEWNPEYATDYRLKYSK